MQHGCNGGAIHAAAHGHDGQFAWMRVRSCHAVAISFFGETSRWRATAAAINSIALSISSRVFIRPTLKRKLARASAGVSPIAVSTCEGSTAPEEHAAPAEQANPAKSNAMTRD